MSVLRVVFSILAGVSLSFLSILFGGCNGASHQQVLRNAEELIAQNQWERAFKQLDELYKTNPTATEARELQILILLKLNQADAALEMYKDLSSRARLPTFLNEAIRNADPAVRAGVCELIAATKPSNSVHLLAKAAKDKLTVVRRVAVQRLAGFDGQKVRDALEDALLDPAWQVRADAAGGLERLGDPEAAEHLFQNMLDGDEFVRLKTRRAIEAVIADGNLSVYRRALKHNNLEVRTAAALAMATRNDPLATSVLYEALMANDSSIRVAASRSLAHMGDRSARPLLRESLSDTNPNVRATAALALAELGDIAATNQLMLLVHDDPVEGVRVAAAQAFQILSPPRSPLVQITPDQGKFQ